MMVEKKLNCFATSQDFFEMLFPQMIRLHLTLVTERGIPILICWLRLDWPSRNWAWAGGC